jgi:hypothetical protein
MKGSAINVKEKLYASLGVFGYILYYALALFLTFMPLSYLQFPFYVDFIMMAAVLIVPFVGQIVELAIWVWSFVLVVTQPIGWFEVIYFVSALIYVFTTVFPFVMSLFAGRREMVADEDD